MSPDRKVSKVSRVQGPSGTVLDREVDRGTPLFAADVVLHINIQLASFAGQLGFGATGVCEKVSEAILDAAAKLGLRIQVSGGVRGSQDRTASYTFAFAREASGIGAVEEYPRLLEELEREIDAVDR